MLHPELEAYWGLGFKVKGLGFRGFKVKGLGFRGFKVKGLGLGNIPFFGIHHRVLQDRRWLLAKLKDFLSLISTLKPKPHRLPEHKTS